jgi:hypothetical protein
MFSYCLIQLLNHTFMFSEWFMGVRSTLFHNSPVNHISQVAAMKGYANANSIAMDLWEDVYPDVLLLALTDTFSTVAFFKA